jgi:hypothetical protein
MAIVHAGFLVQPDSGRPMNCVILRALISRTALKSELRDWRNLHKRLMASYQRCLYWEASSQDSLGRDYGRYWQKKSTS